MLIWRLLYPITKSEHIHLQWSLSLSHLFIPGRRSWQRLQLRVTKFRMRVMLNVGHTQNRHRGLLQLHKYLFGNFTARLGPVWAMCLVVIWYASKRSIRNYDDLRRHVQKEFRCMWFIRKLRWALSFFILWKWPCGKISKNAQACAKHSPWYPRARQLCTKVPGACLSLRLPEPFCSCSIATEITSHVKATGRKEWNYPSTWPQTEDHLQARTVSHACAHLRLRLESSNHQWCWFIR